MAGMRQPMQREGHHRPGGAQGMAGDDVAMHHVPQQLAQQDASLLRPDPQRGCKAPPHEIHQEHGCASRVDKNTEAKNALHFDRSLIFGAKTCDRDSEPLTMPGTPQRSSMNDTKADSRTRQEALGQFLTATPVADFMASAAKFPDVIVHHPAKNWLMLIEAVTSAGPVDGKRRKKLKDLFAGCKAGLVFVTAFENRRTMQTFVSHIAWESEVWIADDPDHMIHFNGERFLGPYPDVIPPT